MRVVVVVVVMVVATVVAMVMAMVVTIVLVRVVVRVVMVMVDVIMVNVMVMVIVVVMVVVHGFGWVGVQSDTDLFNIYSDIILRNIEQHEGVKVGGHNINNLRYVDDSVINADSEEKLQNILTTVTIKSENKELHLNAKKTECMVISKHEDVEAQKFYEEIEKAKGYLKSHNIIIVLGDFNAKVGDERIEDVGPRGIGTVNDRGSRLIEWCQINDFTTQILGIKTTLGDSGLVRAPEIEEETKYITSSFRNNSKTPSKHRSHCQEPAVIQIIFQ
ncbi:hypothetical protein PoB_000483400 [Plakobranchus ocellatus]|uniref:Reverse transcriptase domain-containing protein n=1 Tax=Plakobranchus ocellatus TaxID=259542 RepID=A0AAV3Y5X4_9GAST|nr:hypothetical protein PoB_000483400 [Plakobranchus ocellatus]